MDALRDVNENKHLFFNTSETFGQEGQNLEDQRMLEPAGIEINGKQMLINDVFRAVHDFFGHARRGLSFGPRGEFNAWREHSALYSGEAQGALAAETIGQTAWTQLGPHLLNQKGELLKPGEPGFAPRKTRPYAEQKNIVLPPELVSEAKGVQFQPESEKANDKIFKADSDVVQRGFWVNPDGKLIPSPESHEKTARKILKLPSAEENESEEGRKQLYDKGWLRAVVDNDSGGYIGGKTIFIEGKAFNAGNKTQLNELERLAIENEHTLRYDPSSGADEPLYSPPKTQFQPGGKEKDEWTLRRAPGVKFSKAWILPNGTPWQLGGQWHHEALNESPELLKKYGIPATDSSEENRVSALQKGFARINYDTHNGLLTVEARAADWRKLKPSVERLVDENLDSIDRMTVNLMNPKVTQVADSQTGTLFDKNTPAEKMASVPFLGTEGRGTQFQPGGDFESKDFESELDKIRAGKSGGQTFTASGDVWTPKNPKVDIVSLASVNVPQGELTKENFLDAVQPYQDLLENPNVVAGVFSFSKSGTPTVSIDINAIVPQKHRENTVAFAKDNAQRAIFDVDKSESVETGGSGDTKLSKPEEILDALDPLLRGKPVNVDDILKQNVAPGEKATQENLFGNKEPVSSAALGSMTKAELAQQYPEAVVARRRGEIIPSDIKTSPLAKEAGSEEAAISAFARRLVEFAKEYQDNPIFKAGAKWYEDFVPQLKKQFGEHAGIMAELLAATSPRTDVQSNYAYALDALEGFKSGRFKKSIAKFEEGLAKLEDDKWLSWYNKEEKAGNIANPPAQPTPAAFMEHWINKYDLKPKQSNGKLYGTHSIRLLQVFARRWSDLNTGPKTRTFVSNLLGSGHDATIDVWADRTMRRLGYSGFEDRWRILPQNAGPVTDEDFYFSQKAFAQAAKELGMKPDALQGALWFAEKQHWANNGWARLDLGSFQTELGKTAMLRQGIAQRSAVSKAEAKAKAPQQQTADLFVEPRNLK
jgi:hypothetical protein